MNFYRNGISSYRKMIFLKDKKNWMFSILSNEFSIRYHQTCIQSEKLNKKYCSKIKKKNSDI